MTAIETEHLAVITGPVIFRGLAGEYKSDLALGEVVEIEDIHPDQFGDVWVFGRESKTHDYISVDSLTPLDEIQADDTVKWGDLLDPDYVHDYVWEGEE